MGRKKVKLAFVVNENKRALSLKKRRLGLVKKAKELSTLCDTKACLIMYNPKEAEPMVWPSADAARYILGEFFALPIIEQKRKETNLQSYLTEKTEKAHEQLMTIRKMNKEQEIDQLMAQLQIGRRGFRDLNLNEIHNLLSFSKDKVMLLRNKLGSVPHPPLRDPPANPFEARPQEFGATANDVFLGGGQDGGRSGMNYEAGRRINIGDVIRDNPPHYIMDKWFFPSSEPVNPQIHQTVGMEMASCSENPNPASYLPQQGSSSSGNPHLQQMQPIGTPMMTFPGLVGPVSQPLQPTGTQMMTFPGLVGPVSQPSQPTGTPMMTFPGLVGPVSQPLQPTGAPMMTFPGLVGPVSQPLQPTGAPMMTFPGLVGPQPLQPTAAPMMTFPGLFGPVSQPLQQHHYNNNPMVSMSQPMPFRFEEGSNINTGGSQFQWGSNTMMTNDGPRQVPPPPPPPPPNGTTGEEGNVGATSLFDINSNWPGFNNDYF